jgi:dephospho-CoA kinase
VPDVRGAAGRETMTASPERPRHIPLIGVAGGIASGKSLITEQLRNLGAAVIVADLAAHNVLKLEKIKQAARERWGDAIFGPDGEIDRPRLGKIVFAPPPAGPAELEYLEHLVHPRVRQLIRQQIDDLTSQPTTRAIVLDVPLLFESGWNKFCDTILFVDAPRDVRLQRAAERGWTAEEFDRREAAQLAVDSKRQQSTLVIDNAGSKQAAQEQVDKFWQSVVEPTASKNRISD